MSIRAAQQLDVPERRGVEQLDGHAARAQGCPVHHRHRRWTRVDVVYLEAEGVAAEPEHRREVVHEEVQLEQVHARVVSGHGSSLMDCANLATALRGGLTTVACPRALREPVERCLRRGGLAPFDGVASWVPGEAFLAAGAGDDVCAECSTGPSEMLAE